MTSIGPLGPADEYLHHQMADTFATVAQSDVSWTEKVWAMAAARDGSLSVGFGLGKYANRAVIDAAGGVSRGREQFAVRASRELGSKRDEYTVGPLRYEIIEPLERIRFLLEATDHQPVSFDWTFAAALPARVERREQRRSAGGGRLEVDLVRYHHIGVAEGWVEVEGNRTEMTTDEWVSTRDHSWGLRYGVGVPVADLATAVAPEDLATLVMWCPVLCERADGTRYGLHWYYQRSSFGSWSRVELQGGVEHPDGRQERFTALREDKIELDPDNRRFVRAQLDFTMADGSHRPLTVSAISDTGFHLGAALYFGLDGHFHGEHRGPLLVEGEHTPDCTTPEAARRLHQLRDCIVRVEDPAGGGIGWGNLEGMATGPHPELGLAAETSFI